jgi:hypothetical protein
MRGARRAACVMREPRRAADDGARSRRSTGVGQEGRDGGEAEVKGTARGVRDAGAEGREGEAEARGAARGVREVRDEGTEACGRRRRRDEINPRRSRRYRNNNPVIQRM